MSEAPASAPTIYAYLDDSTPPGGCIAVAAVVIDAPRVTEAEAVVAAAKDAIGVPTDVPLHCREMFSGDARRGTPWESVNPEAIDAMVVKICSELKSVCRRPIVCPIPPGTVSPSAVAPGALFEGFEAKGIANFAYGGIFAHLTNVYGRTVRLHIDPDTTKTPWLNRKREQAERTRDFFMSLDLAAGEKPPKVTPIVQRDPKPALLQVADVYAWTTARALTDRAGRRGRWCWELMTVVSPEELTFELAQQDWQKIRPQ